MGIGALVEPAIVVSLLFGGAWINRNSTYTMFPPRKRSSHYQDPLGRLEEEIDGFLPKHNNGLGEDGHRSGHSSPSLLLSLEPTWRRRTITLFGMSKTFATPNTRMFQDRMLSRLLRKFPFLVEVWYWALIYWVYQLGRAFTAVTLVDSTVDVARSHALSVIQWEQALHVFWELHIQGAFMAHPLLMHWTNRVYSFIHIPGTISFLVALFYYTTTSNQVVLHEWRRNRAKIHGGAAGPALYEARRRTMAMCNLIAFVAFTLWPCMPPRLLSDTSTIGSAGDVARGYGFVDTVHGAKGESSVWTQNKFCNQYAAMPSLHFGYSLLIGLTILTIPIRQDQRHTTVRAGVRRPSLRRIILVALGMLYPAIILLAIISTANHFILDAVAGACVCGVAWYSNGILLNLLAVEDYFLWLLRIHKPEITTMTVTDGAGDEKVLCVVWPR